MQRMFKQARVMFPGLSGAYAVYYFTKKKAEKMKKEREERKQKNRFLNTVRFGLY